MIGIGKFVEFCLMLVARDVGVGSALNSAPVYRCVTQFVVH